MKLGWTQLELPPLGLGCWAIGGQFSDLGAPGGWGDVKDEESLKALETGIDMGIRLIDTANIYGAGHSEYLVGKAIRGKRDKVLVTTKFGILMDEEAKKTAGIIRGPEDIIRSCEDSLRRLGTDYIDILLFHCGDYEKKKAPEVLETLEKLVENGKIRYYGWSTSDPERAKIFAEGKHCVMMEFAENVMEDNPAMRQFCKENHLTACCRSPLAMGILTGKYKKGMVMPENDLRGKNAPPWMEYFIDGKPNEIFLKKLEAVREILTSKGRSLAQGCIAWIWGNGEHCVPIPGFKTAQQVTDNIKSLEYGPLTEKQMEEVAGILHSME